MKYVVNRMTVFNDSKVYLIFSKRGRTYNFYIIDDAIIDVNKYVFIEITLERNPSAC